MALKQQLKKQNLTIIIALIILFCLGFFFRFANLGKKIFWVDEVATAIRVSGYTISEVTQELEQQDIVGINSLFTYQTISSDKTYKDSFKALTKSPEHTPLYFLLTRGWLQLWGNSITVMRNLSVWLSFLIFPCLYWLCQELFNKPLVSSLAVMFMSVSPFYVAYAQEARPYSLWTVTILLMGASFLRAIRLNSWQSWGLYSLSLILGFYTSLLSIYISFFQGIYLVLISNIKSLNILKNYVISSLIALLAFSPWILIIIRNYQLLNENTSWMRDSLDLAGIIGVCIGTILLIFGDLPLSQSANPIQIAITLILIVFILGIIFRLRFALATFFVPKRKLLTRDSRKHFILFLIILSSSFCLLFYLSLDWVAIIGAVIALFILILSTYSLHYLINNTYINQWLFIITLILSVPVPLSITDIINQGQSLATPRYLIPVQLGIQIAVVYTLASKLQSKSNYNQKLGKIITIFFLSLGVFSCCRNLNLSPIYQKSRNVENTAIAQIINRSNSPLVIVESANVVDVLSLGYSLSPQTKFKVISPKENITAYTNKSNHVFVLRPSSQLQSQLKQSPQIKFQQIYKPRLFSTGQIHSDLWSLKKIK
jgi:uncharacterized membrane protein